MPLCDEIDPRAAAIGAVNTVVNRNGRLTGYNTDIDGFLYMARRAGVDMAGKKVVILGSGGTSRTARAAAGELGAREIITVSRHGEDNYQNLSRHADAQVLVNTTPVGMYPNWGKSPVSLESFPALEGVLDVVYNPLRTALLLQAEERGLPRSCGLPMLVAQAKRAAELFTGQNIDDSRAEAVLHGLWEQLTSIVSSGCPAAARPLWAAPWPGSWAGHSWTWTRRSSAVRGRPSRRSSPGRGRRASGSGSPPWSGSSGSAPGWWSAPAAAWSPGVRTTSP